MGGSPPSGYRQVNRMLPREDEVPVVKSPLAYLRDRAERPCRTPRAQRRRDKRLARQRFSAQLNQEFLDATSRDIGGLGRVDPDRRR
jgi:hypothetical protein